MAVLSKAGCNMGACHGNQNGKGGFRLSLRGQDPAYDFRQLLQSFGARRVDLLEPASSMILLKPTGQLAHQGGVRFDGNSQLYRILHAWIAAGAPAAGQQEPLVRKLEATPTDQVLMDPLDHVQLKVVATLSDGTQHDVTNLAVYEPSNMVATITPKGRVERAAAGETTVMVRYLQQQVPVRVAFIPSRPDYVWPGIKPHNYIDEHVFAKLRRLRMYPSDSADDSTFVRRAYLDALGILPTATEARSFISDPYPNKRARLVDDLLARPEFANHWALNWSDLLRNEEKVLDSMGVEVFYDWIRDSMASDKPWDDFASALVSGNGSTYDNPPANYYRAQRDPITRAETTARLFLGVRLQCAQCHNHPFDRWTQDDYYTWAANFSGIDYEIIENKRRDKNDKHEFVGEQIVKVAAKTEMENPATGDPAPPRYLGAEQPAPDKAEDRLDQLAQWLTSGENRRFAETQVNFIWYHIMGRGLVDPIDDFRATNPAMNPELLDALADDFVANNHSLRHLVRTIMTSYTYQAAAVPNETNSEDQSNFSRSIVRRLTAEELLDAQCQVLDVSAGFAGYDSSMRAGSIPGVRKVRERDEPLTAGDRFLTTFGKPERLLACECERTNETTLAQALVLIGSADFQERLTQEGNRLQRLIHSDRSPAEIVDELYWSALSRGPTSAELEAAQTLLAGETGTSTALEDLAWALLNSKEFMFRR